MTHRKGFTLIEVIVILAVIAILAAMAVPAALRIFQVTAESTTRGEMDNIRKAILGDRQKLQGSFRSDFGFLGDIGCLPTALDGLLTAGTLPTPYAFDATKQTGAGWKGPYISGTPGEVFTQDQWGNDYVYTPAVGACPLTATLTSNGPDGTAGGGDDIILSITAAETTATVRGTVKDMTGVGLGAVSVELYAANQGALPGTPPSQTTDVNGNYVFAASAPFGPRAVRAIPPAFFFLLPGSPTTLQNGERVFFTVVNYSGTAITITSMTVTWTSSTGTRYDDIFINQVQADNCNNVNSGVLCDINPDFTVNANPTPSASRRVFVDSAETQLPDIQLTTGSTATFRLDFETGDDMRGGRTWTVVFNHTGGPSTVTFVIP